MTFLNMWGDGLEELQKQFDELTECKKALWETIAGRLAYEDIYYGYAHEKQSEWHEIVKIDQELIALDAKIKGGNA